MMFERFTADARTVVIHAQQHARRLGHRYIGCEHLLLALVASDTPAGGVLREHGITPERVEDQIVRRSGLGAAAGLFADLDRDALASIGIDLDAVRARIEASVPLEVLTRAGESVQCGPRRARRRRLVALLHRWRRRRRAQRGLAVSAAAPVTPPPATGRYRAAGLPLAGHLPFTPGSKRTLEMSLREAMARHDRNLGVEHIALSLLATTTGPVPPILALGGSAGALRAAIVDRYRLAS
jgi:Clp amino terminal domain, pathogenicity island component